MRKLLISKFFLLAIILTMGACTHIEDDADEDPFAIFLNIKNVNQSLNLIYQDTLPLNKGHIESKVFLDVRNYSDKRIWFPDDWGLKIYRSDNNSWVEIRDSMTSFQTEDIVLAPYGDEELRDIGAPVVDPDIPNEGHPVTIRVVVIGNVMNGDVVTDEQAAAYVDITLQP